MRTILRIIAEILLFLIWVAAIALMFRHKAGCENDGKHEGYLKPDKKKLICLPNGDFHEDEDLKGHEWYHKNAAPLWKWNLGIAFGIVEA